MDFIGLENYIDLFHDSQFYSVLLNTCLYVIVSVPLGMVVSLFLALLLNDEKIKGNAITRVLVYWPTLLSTIMVGVTWKWIFGESFGVMNYILTSIGFARRLFGQQGMLSQLELRLKPGSDLDAVKAEMREIAGSKYRVLDRMEQQADTFKIMKIEKFIAYIILTFILVVACFNIIGSLSMLIIDKKNDVVTLRNMGATDKQITRIFLLEGRMISVIGAIAGILLGLLLCWLQQEYGLVALGRSSGSFVVDAYPVSVHPEDIVIVFITVIAVGFVSVWYPVRYFAKRLINN